uniref:Uncharacterized protein LOC111102709 n=1 Tax=Crassostrea virginica TaxID=6565 RepID=A0A8B8AMG6_CRAVI|nr:uncharacterized protein LOC111102709 [Crassostrea virginica]
MHGLRAIHFVPLVLINIVETKGLLANGNSNNSDPIHGSSGHNVDTTDIMQLLLNQTTELENLRQQVETFKQQAENDRITMQNRIFLLETELIKLNASKPPSTQEFSTYLMSMNQLIQSVATNEENDKNVTNQLNVAVKQLDELKAEMLHTRLNQSREMEHYKQQSESEKLKVYLLQNLTQRMSQRLDDLNVQFRYTSLSLLDLHTATEQLNGSLLHQLEERISNVHDDIIANVSTGLRIGFTAVVTSTSSSWNSGTLVFPKVITNVGNGYNPSDGVFTAPKAGVYVFFVNVQSYNTQSIYVDIVLNGAIKVRTMASDAGGSEFYEAGPNLAVLSLQTGDRVWIKYYAGQGYWTYSDGPLTTFSGFLI